MAPAAIATLTLVAAVAQLGCEAIAGYDDLPAASQTEPSTACPDAGDVAYAGHCYFLTASALSWSGAAAACSAQRAHLATIGAPGEETVAESYATEAWLGLSRGVMSPPTKSQFRWVTGEASTFDGWRIGEPNGSGTCARTTSTGWADANCATAYPGLCERELG